jgi:ssDNA-binding Zn-finger/Zn-ribbon topoisomerase 1
MSTKKPRFFCDNCGAEVPMSAKNCPQCGRFFASVRCPKCGFTGKDEDFVRGCPACGYSAVPATASAATEGNPRRQWTGRPEKAAASLPFWIYLFAALIFICVLTILYNLLR